MLEAKERYFAYHWWEDRSIRHSLREMNRVKDATLVGLGIADKFDQVFQIQIGTPGLEDVLVLVGMLPAQGFVVGCAAGWAWERHITLFRSSVELMRHYHIIEKLRTSNEVPSSMYSQKLLHLASGTLDNALKARLKSVGSKDCPKPRVLFDSEISHRFDKLYYVHRFAFENQPDIVSNNSNIII
jgi:hypothetical protein